MAANSPNPSTAAEIVAAIARKQASAFERLTGGDRTRRTADGLKLADTPARHQHSHDGRAYNRIGEGARPAA
jgi:hypothetical protein